MNVSIFIKELFVRNSVLASAGVIHLLGFAVSYILSLIDKRKVAGVNVWIKPMKFFSSVAIYIFSLCWILFYLPVAQQWLSITIAILMYIENFFITLQAGRGTTSHFNNKSIFDGIVFSIMGIAITLNTLLCAYILFLFFTNDVKITESYLWGIRFGLLIFILASLEGFVMVKRRSNTISKQNKLNDGSKGLPFLNWSREGGDLRIAHFIGIHALQVLPIAGAFIRNLPVIIIISILYFIISALLFLQAIKGRVFMKKYFSL